MPTSRQRTAKRSSSIRKRTEDEKQPGRWPFGPVQIGPDPKTGYTPWLLIRYAAGDTGIRPLPAPTVFWESPDVWVTSSRGINQPVPETANKVFARVTNYGLQQANGVVVKFWWANPSLAITESTSNLIGIGFADIPSLRSTVITCPNPWIPVVENGGHECLLAEAYVPALDPLTSPMDPVADRHVGQKNEQLVVARPGEQFHIHLDAVNASSLAQQAIVEIHPVLMDTVPNLVKVRRPEAQPPQAAQIPLSLAVERERSSFIPASVLFATRLFEAAQPSATRTLAEAWPSPQISHTAALEPWERIVLELTGTIPYAAQVGQTFLFRVVQRLDSIVVGGYTFAVLVEKTAKPPARRSTSRK